MWVVRQTYPGGDHLEPQSSMIQQVGHDPQPRRHAHRVASSVRRERLLHGLGIPCDDRQQHLRWPLRRAMSLFPVLDRIKRQAEGPRELDLGHLQAAANLRNVDTRNDSYSHCGLIAFDGGQSLPGSCRISFLTVERFCVAMNYCSFRWWARLVS